MSMQNQICAWFGIACPQMLVVGGMSQKFDADGNLIDEKFINNIKSFTTEFIWLTEAVTSKKAAN